MKTEYQCCPSRQRTGFHRSGLICILASIILAPRLAAQDTVRATATQTLSSVPRDTLPGSIDVTAANRRLRAFHSNDNLPPLDTSQVELGRKLFFDPILSRDGTVACATCHRPEHGFADNHAVAIGILSRTGRRNAPSLMNRAVGKTQFWDGRALTLEAQSLQPIQSSNEMGHELGEALQALRDDDDYLKAFAAAFDAAPGSKAINSKNLASALASFQRTLTNFDSPVDRFQAGDYSALTQSQRQGLWIFESRGRCWKCHSGNNYSDEKFHNLGIDADSPSRDKGRFEVTGNKEDQFSFKTPSLRGVANTGPFMHNGSFRSLRDVVEFYNEGGGIGDPLLDKEIEPLGLSESEVDHLIEFLTALSENPKWITARDESRTKPYENPELDAQ